MPSPGELVLEAPRRGKPPVHLADLSGRERREAMADLGLPGFRADQVSRHWFGRLDNEPETWTDLSPDDREAVSTALLPRLLTPVLTQQCDGGATVKTLWQLHDGSRVESVLMGYRDRITMCVSSQAGCGMNCPFCATGQAGLTRNLSTAEIVEQVMAGARLVRSGALPGDRDRVSNVVFMGMGEPLANYRALMGAVHRLVDPVPDGLGMSARGITVSTVGLVPRIRELAEEGLPLRLAVSLHAPDDELRDTLVPINTRYPVSEVLDAAWFYAERTGRRISIEYALIRDVNDQQWRAERLADLLRGHLVHVNLIPLNPTPGSAWTASAAEDERAFVRALEAKRVPVTVRDTRGREIDGACGQLAATAP
ncbi:MAG: 23S rRNA (adenine(2503)-C(2))-methyltransferase RlmN [Candidatus Nanopelagicales bacterium]